MASTRSFTFRQLPSKTFSGIHSRTGMVYDSLLKWSMNGRLKAQAFSYDQPYQSYQAKDFILAFMQDPNVIGSLCVVSESGKPTPVGIEATSVKYEMIPCTQLSMCFFDRLYNEKVVRAETGNIVKCFEDYYEASTTIPVSDELRKMLLIEDSDNYPLYSNDERSEFLFRVFKHLCLGGAICQFEDVIQPYLDVTKAIYKDLVSVHKDDSGQLSLTSHVYKISAYNDEGRMYYPADTPHEQNFAYLCIDPSKRHVNVLYHKIGASVFS